MDGHQLEFSLNIQYPLYQAHQNHRRRPNRVNRTVLDVVIKFDIPHGGWIPKGWKTEDIVLPDKYQLQGMPTDLIYDKR